MARVHPGAPEARDPYIQGWRSAWRAPRFRGSLALTVAVLAGTLALLSHVLQLVEQRPGARLEDPLLALFSPRDLSTATFTVIYGCMLVALIDLARRPWSLLRALIGYILVALARAAMMWVTPLDPPEHLIPLRDPFIETFGPGALLTRDLFFSGHTSTLFLLALCVPSRWLRAPLFVATLAVAALVLAQHAHYTIDVLVAPCVAFCAFRLADCACARVNRRR